MAIPTKSVSPIPRVPTSSRGPSTSPRPPGRVTPHLVLQRAVEDNESAVALGAIEALRLTAGEASLIGTEDYKQPLVEALQFPDLLVRTRAALALGAALPKSQFAGSQNVVPVLAAALTQTGRPHILVVDGDEENLNRVMNALRATGANAIGEKNFFVGMNRAPRGVPEPLRRLRRQRYHRADARHRRRRLPGRVRKLEDPGDHPHQAE